MKRITVALAVLLTAVPAVGQEGRIANEKDRISYSIGYQVGSDLKKQGLEIEPGMLLRGAQDALEGNSGAMSDEEMKETLTNLKRKIDLAVADEKRLQAEENLTKAKAFLAENGSREGVVTRASGLQYEVLTEGTGINPTVDDNVTVHYTGYLIDGTETESTRPGSPVTFRAGATIPGWKEALPLMKEGAVWKLYLLPELGYGQAGTLKSGPGALLVYEVELVKVEKKEE
jgi:FKBP-type peptidyl-prolyl cis-trans isomerase FklB